MFAGRIADSITDTLARTDRFNLGHALLVQELRKQPLVISYISRIRLKPKLSEFIAYHRAETKQSVTSFKILGQIVLQTFRLKTN